jgi:hypothetical protein
MKPRLKHGTTVIKQNLLTKGPEFNRAFLFLVYGNNYGTLYRHKRNYARDQNPSNR